MHTIWWLRWEVPVCALIILIPTALSILFIKKQRETQSLLYSSQLWMPCWTNLSPLWLLLYRVFAFISMSLFLYLTLFTLSPCCFVYYTLWSFSLIIFYFALATIISTIGYWNYSKNRCVPFGDGFSNKDPDYHNQMQVVQQRAGFWEIFMQNVYQTCAGAVILTDIVFWCLLPPFPGGDKFTLTLLGWMHSVNVVFFLMDTALNSLPLPWHGLAYFVLFSSSYVVFQWGLHVYGFTWWPYPFFELATPWAPLWYIGLTLVHLPCYGLYMLLVQMKGTLFPRMFPHAFLRDVTGKKQT